MNSLELHHLRYFLAVAEELHFGRAARRLHITQPPLSQQIRQLEEALHLQLFYRTSRKVVLTPAGRVLAGEARIILQQVERAVEQAAQTNRGRLSRLVVGYSPPHTRLVIDIIKLFRAQHPEVDVLLKSLLTFQQVQALRNGRIDVGFVSLPVEAQGLLVETIRRERLVVALPKDHPLSRRTRIPLRLLATETHIIIPWHLNPGRYGMIAQLYRMAGFSLNVVHEVDNIPDMLELVRAGFGVSIMRASVQTKRSEGVVFRELAHSPVVETAVAYRRGDQPKIVGPFIETSREAGVSLSD